MRTNVEGKKIVGFRVNPYEKYGLNERITEMCFTDIMGVPMIKVVIKNEIERFFPLASIESVSLEKEKDEPAKDR